jgi:hypothetical protein
MLLHSTAMKTLVMLTRPACRSLLPGAGRVIVHGSISVDARIVFTEVRYLARIGPGD